jgi:catechol-2,3-dioxygenase
MPIKLSRIGHTAVRVRDIERSKKWYTEVMGFRVEEQDPEHGGLFMSVGRDDVEEGHMFDVVQVDDPATAAAPPDRNQVGVAHVAIKVDTHEDMKDAYDHLLSHGVAVDRLIEHANQRSMYFEDPDGNRLEIYYEFPTSKELFRRGRGDRDFIFTFDDPVPPWATKVPDDWDPDKTVELYHRGTAGRMND